MSTPTLARVQALPFTAAQQLLTLRSQVGRTESPPGSNRTPYGAAVGLNGVPWCAVLPAWGWLEHGVSWAHWWTQLGARWWAYVPSLLDTGKRAGLTVPVAAARPGDLICFNWEGGTVPDHIGTLIGWDGPGTLHTIEGNTSSGNAGSQDNGGGVFERLRPRGLVVGVLRPPYAAPPLPRPPVARRSSTAPAPLLRRDLHLTNPWQRGGDVSTLQALLRRAGARVAIDGVFGPATDRAVRAYQGAHHLAVDGDVGPRTATALGFRWAG